MNKFLLSAALTAASLTAFADPGLYFVEADGVDNMAEARGMSPNGRYAVFCNPDDAVTFLWDAQNPTEFKQINDKNEVKFDGYDVTDDGMIVGAIEKKGQNADSSVRLYFQPVIWINGEYTELEMPVETANGNYAMFVSGDGKIIGGQTTCKPSVKDCGYPAYPILWEKNDAGTYEMHVGNHITIPDNQGFWPKTMYTDGTLQGTVLGGLLNTHGGSWIPALYKNEDLVVWNTIEKKNMNWWIAHPLVNNWDVYEAYYVDGFIEGFASQQDFLDGCFLDCDKDGNFYGYRTVVTEPAPASTYGEEYLPYDEAKQPLNGKLQQNACVYNLHKEEFTDYPGNTVYTTGRGDLRFDTQANAWDGTEKKGLSSLLGLDLNTPGSFAGIMRVSDDGKTLAAQYTIFNPATANPDPYPVMITLDNPVSAGIGSLTAEAKASIRGVKGGIEVDGAECVSIYNLQGQLVATGNRAALPAGLYVVKADSATAKVLVK